MRCNELPARRLMRVAFICLIALVSLGSSCDEEELQRALAGEAATSGTVLSAIVNAQTDTGTSGSPTAGPLQSGVDPNFTLTLTPSGNAVTNGGTASITLTAPTAFTQVNVGANDLDGFYLITLPAPTTSVTIQPTVDQDYISPTIRFQFSVGDGITFGPVAEQLYNVIIVGTGDIQVSLTFDQGYDVDLAVLDPNGDRVFWGDTTVPSGGTLDLDANAACAVSTVNAENITWPTGSAPAGTYQVFVNLFAECPPGALAPVNWTLTVSVVGQTPTLINGRHTPPGEVGDDRLVHTFMVTP